MLDRAKLRHMLVHLIYIHAIVIKSYQVYEHDHEEMDNVEKLFIYNYESNKNESDAIIVYFVEQIL